MLYEMADHLKEAYEEELIAKIDATLEELRRLDEGKIPAGLQAYLDKKKGKKGNGDKKEEENGNGNGNGSKGSKPDFLDLDKDGDKKEPMKKAAKEKKEETEYNYVNAYVEKVMGADTGMRMMAAKDRMKGKDKLLSKKEGDANAAHMAKKIKMSPSYAGAMGEELINSGVFSEEEITKFIWVEFDESIEENRQVAYEPEKYKDPDESDKPYRQRSRAARMRDPKRGINSPAFKKFMADRGMSV
jgi:Mn-dependent DtxR family transcriptional regulator